MVIIRYKFKFKWNFMP